MRGSGESGGARDAESEEADMVGEKYLVGDAAGDVDSTVATSSWVGEGF